MRKIHFFLISLITFYYVECQEEHNVEHNQISVPNCDDAINGIGIDWDGDDHIINPDFYECNSTTQTQLDDQEVKKDQICNPPPMAYHVCVDSKLEYEDPVPIGGPHRPVWPTYGEYTFIPPQRWLHSLEHGAAVFLYDPCANKEETEKLKSVAKSCLRRHIITPYTKLPPGQSFNVVTFGCRLVLNQISGFEQAIRLFLQDTALKGPETIPHDGNYKFGLIKQSEIVSDYEDSNVCPSS